MREPICNSKRRFQSGAKRAHSRTRRVGESVWYVHRIRFSRVHVTLGGRLTSAGSAARAGRVRSVRGRVADGVRTGVGRLIGRGAEGWMLLAWNGSDACVVLARCFFDFFWRNEAAFDFEGAVARFGDGRFAVGVVCWDLVQIIGFLSCGREAR